MIFSFLADFYKKKETPKNLFFPLCHDTGYRYFYSRTRKGCDHKEWLRVLALISTHTPVKGVTANIYKMEHENLLVMYIFAPTRL